MRLVDVEAPDVAAGTADSEHLSIPTTAPEAAPSSKITATRTELTACGAIAKFLNAILQLVRIHSECFGAALLASHGDRLGGRIAAHRRGRKSCADHISAADRCSARI